MKRNESTMRRPLTTLLVILREDRCGVILIELISLIADCVSVSTGS